VEVLEIPKITFKKKSIEIEKDKVEKYLSYVDNLLFQPKKSLKYDLDSMLVKFLRKKGRYIKNINIEISKSEIAEYKSKLLINFFKEKTNF
jgi:hypothetical protein